MEIGISHCGHVVLTKKFDTLLLLFSLSFISFNFMNLSVMFVFLFPCYHLSHLSWEERMSVMLTYLHLCPHSWHFALSHSGQTFARNLPISHRTLYLISNTSKIICQNKSLLPLKYPFHSKQSVLWYTVFVQRITVQKSIKFLASILL